MSAPQRPGRNGRPARSIQGPQSALTDFLASHNIDANRIRQDADARRAAAIASRTAAESADEAEADAEPAAPIPPPRKKETKAQSNKRKRDEEKRLAKTKLSKQFQPSRRGYDPEDLFDEDDATGAMFEENNGPVPGQMENCEICGTRFTVTTYSRAGPNGGLLCSKCSKEIDNKEGATKKKKRAVAGRNRRKVQSNLLDGIYQTGTKDLMTLCIETLAKNVELAEDLGDLPPKLIDRLAAILSKKRLLTPVTLDLFLKPGLDTVTVYDGAKLSSDDFIKIFQTVPTVEFLRLRNAIQFKNIVMDYLIGCHVALKSFSIHGANLIDDERWNSFLVEKGRHLQSLKIYHTDGHFGDQQLELLTISCPAITRLKVSHNQKVTDVGIKHIANLPSLQHLSLEIYKPTSSGPYVEILKSIGKGLRTFCLSAVPHIDDRVLESIHENCSNLSKLRITENGTVTDNGFAKLFTDWSNPPLSHIDLSKCRLLDAVNPRVNPLNGGLCSAGFEALMIHSGSHLKYLNILSCRHISKETFEKVFSAKKTYPEITFIDISFCTSVDDFVVGSIFRSCPGLKTLKIFGNMGVKNARVPKGRILIGMPNAMGMQIEGEDD